MKSYMKLCLIIACIVPIAVIAPACKPHHRDAAFAAADAACILLEGETDNKTIQKVCATVDELEPYVKYLVRARAWKAAHPNMVGGTSKLDACQVPKE